MSATVQIDDVQLRARLNQLAGFGLDMGRVLKVESRRLMEVLIRKTPPPIEAKGRDHVNADLRKVFFPLADQAVAKAQASGDHVRLWANPSGEVFAAKPENFTPNADLRAEHQKRRVNGRVKSGRAAFAKEGPKFNVIQRRIVPKSRFEAYRREVLTHVGTMRSGWAYAAQAVGARLPQWVRRNMKPENGFVIDHINSKMAPSLTVGNTTPGVEKFMGQTLRAAIRSRVGSIGQNIKRMLKYGPGASGDYGYARA